MFLAQDQVCMHAKLEQIWRNLDTMAKSSLTPIMHQALQILLYTKKITTRYQPESISINLETLGLKHVIVNYLQNPVEF